MTENNPPSTPAGPATGAPASTAGTPQPAGGTPNGSESTDLARIAAELGLTPGQIAGRLEASKKWEQRATARADYDQVKAELETLRAATQTDTERAISEAKAAGQAAARSEAQPRLIAQQFQIEALLAGRDHQAVTGLLEDLDLSKFVAADGSIDADRIKKRIEALPVVGTTGQAAQQRGATGQGAPPAPAATAGAAGLAEAQRRFGTPTPVAS